MAGTELHLDGMLLGIPVIEIMKGKEELKFSFFFAVIVCSPHIVVSVKPFPILKSSLITCGRLNLFHLSVCSYS